MNWFDFTVGVFLLIAFFNGYRKGLIMQLVGLAAIVLAVIFGGRLAQVLLPELNKLLDISPNVAHVLSYLFAFVLIAVVISFVGRIVQKFIDVVHLSFINRILGSVIAIATTMIVLSVILNLVLTLDPEEKLIKKETKDKSFFFERVEAVVPAIVPYLNPEVWNHVPEKYRDEIERKSDSLLQYAPHGQQIDSAYQQRHFNID